MATKGKAVVIVAMKQGPDDDESKATVATTVANVEV